MASVYLALAALLACLLGQAQAKIPNYIHVCKRNDPHLEACILQSIEKLRPRLNKGIPELEVPALEPLNLPLINIANRPNLRIQAKNVAVSGASNFKVTSLKADIDKVQIVAGIAIPFLVFDGTYDVDTKLLGLPVMGKGPVKCNASNVIGDAVLKGHKVKRDGETYVTFDTLTLKLKLENYDVQIDNNNKELRDAMNLLLQSSKQDIMKAIIPRAEVIAADVLLDIANKIVRHFTFKELFPKD